MQGKSPGFSGVPGTRTLPEEAVPNDIGVILTRYTEEASLKLTQMLSTSLESLRKEYLTEDSPASGLPDQ
jgi:hypothetical protein